MRRLIAGLASMTLVALLLGALALTVLRATLRSHQEIVQAYLHELVLTEEMVSASNRAARKARDFLLTGDESHLPEVEAARQHFLQLHEALGTGQVLPEERALLARVHERWLSSREAANRAMEARARTGRVLGETERIIEEELLPRRARFDEALGALLDYERSLFEAARREADEAATRAWRLLAGGFLGAVLASVVLGGLLLRALRQRERAQQELWRTAQFRERLIGIVSHDLRTPLGAISTGASLLLRTEGMPEKALRTVGRIAGSAERMARMIAELLDFTRVRLGGGIPVQRLPSELYPVVRQVVEEAEMAFPGRVVRLEARGDLRGEWDEGRLAQVVGNLLKNALNYSPEDTPVRLVLDEEGPWVRLRVCNHNREGPIPPELLPTLFDPFRRGEAPHTGDNREGLGLGLYIAREIVLAHRGLIEVESTADGGTVFTLRLPRAGSSGPPR